MTGFYRGPVIDSHVHLLDPPAIPLRWARDVPSLNRPFGMADFADATASIDIKHTVFLEVDAVAGRHLDEARWAATQARSHPQLAALVPHAPVEHGDACTDDLQTLAALPNVRGVRRLLQGETDPAFCLRDDFVTGVRKLADFDLHFEICVMHHQLEFAAQLPALAPDVRFVLDHIGKPAIADGSLDPWRRWIEQMAGLPNVWCKFSGLVTEASHDDWTIDQLRPYASHVLEVFAADKLMYGGDWPVVTLASEYQRWFATASALTAHLPQPEQSRLFFDNAAEFYRIR